MSVRQPGDGVVSVVNRPSDGAERSVANSLVVFSAAPTGPLAIRSRPAARPIHEPVAYSVPGRTPRTTRCISTGPSMVGVGRHRHVRSQRGRFTADRTGQRDHHGHGRRHPGHGAPDMCWPQHAAGHRSCRRSPTLVTRVRSWHGPARSAGRPPRTWASASPAMCCSANVNGEGWRDPVGQRPQPARPRVFAADSELPLRGPGTDGPANRAMWRRRPSFRIIVLSEASASIAFHGGMDQDHVAVVRRQGREVHPDRRRARRPTRSSVTSFAWVAATARSGARRRSTSTAACRDRQHLRVEAGRARARVHAAWTTIGRHTRQDRRARDHRPSAGRRRRVRRARPARRSGRRAPDLRSRRRPRRRPPTPTPTPTPSPSPTPAAPTPVANTVALADAPRRIESVASGHRAPPNPTPTPSRDTSMDRAFGRGASDAR